MARCTASASGQGNGDTVLVLAGAIATCRLPCVERIDRMQNVCACISASHGVLGPMDDARAGLAKTNIIMIVDPSSDENDPEDVIIIMVGTFSLDIGVRERCRPEKMVDIIGKIPAMQLLFRLAPLHLVSYLGSILILSEKKSNSIRFCLPDSDFELELDVSSTPTTISLPMHQQHLYHTLVHPGTNNYHQQLQAQARLQQYQGHAVPAPTHPLIPDDDEDGFSFSKYTQPLPPQPQNQIHPTSSPNQVPGPNPHIDTSSASNMNFSMAFNNSSSSSSNNNNNNMPFNSSPPFDIPHLTESHEYGDYASTESASIDVKTPESVREFMFGAGGGGDSEAVGAEGALRSARGDFMFPAASEAGSGPFMGSGSGASVSTAYPHTAPFPCPPAPGYPRAGFTSDGPFPPGCDFPSAQFSFHVPLAAGAGAGAGETGRIQPQTQVQQLSPRSHSQVHSSPQPHFQHQRPTPAQSPSQSPSQAQPHGQRPQRRQSQNASPELPAKLSPSQGQPRPGPVLLLSTPARTAAEQARAAAAQQAQAQQQVQQQQQQQSQAGKHGQHQGAGVRNIAPAPASASRRGGQVQGGRAYMQTQTQFQVQAQGSLGAQGQPQAQTQVVRPHAQFESQSQSQQLQSQVLPQSQAQLQSQAPANGQGGQEDTRRPTGACTRCKKMKGCWTSFGTDTGHGIRSGMDVGIYVNLAFGTECGDFPTTFGCSRVRWIFAYSGFSPTIKRLGLGLDLVWRGLLVGTWVPWKGDFPCACYVAHSYPFDTTFTFTWSSPSPTTTRSTPVAVFSKGVWF
ncbi:hypothetical protein BU17DRAFT_68065 [Hysterangium stoloniferum]|nr:hypothetical protein BU17DRAFT_68065 [Hysterangium stoloniferum]